MVHENEREWRWREAALDHRQSHKIIQDHHAVLSCCNKMWQEIGSNHQIIPDDHQERSWRQSVSPGLCNTRNLTLQQKLIMFCNSLTNDCSLMVIRTTLLSLSDLLNGLLAETRVLVVGLALCEVCSQSSRKESEGENVCVLVVLDHDDEDNTISGHQIPKSLPFVRKFLYPFIMVKRTVRILTDHDTRLFHAASSSALHQEKCSEAERKRQTHTTWWSVWGMCSSGPSDPILDARSPHATVA